MPTVDLPLIMPDEVSAPAPRRGPPPRPAPPPEPARASVPLPLLDLEPARPRAADDDGAADAGALSQVEPVLTETMAELYLKQGHKTDALRVYQALLLQRPGDVQLAAKIAQLSGQGMQAPAAAAPPPRRRSGPGSGETVGSFLKGVLSGRRVTPPPAPAPRAQSRRSIRRSAAARRRRHRRSRSANRRGRPTTPFPWTRCSATRVDAGRERRPRRRRRDRRVRPAASRSTISSAATRRAPHRRPRPRRCPRGPIPTPRPRRPGPRAAAPGPAAKTKATWTSSS